MLFLLSILRGPYSAGSHGCKSSQHSWLVETISSTYRYLFIPSICWPVETIPSICWPVKS